MRRLRLETMRHWTTSFRLFSTDANMVRIGADEKGPVAQ